MGKYSRRFGDRYDGRLIRTLDAFSKIIPYIMPTRLDSQNLFEEKIEIDSIEEYLKAKRKTGMKIGVLHIIIAAIVRTMSQKPQINRFVCGRKIYARNDILISLAIKKQLLENSPETTIKLKFDPRDTLYDVVKKINEAISENKNIQSNNETDRTANLFMKLPGFFIKYLVWLLKKLDNYGLMPKAINRVSPFHTSAFITDLGSLGIQPIYHHLYEFGTTSVFIAFGAKQKESIVSDDKNIEKKYIRLKIVTDERIVDGFYYASAFKLLKRLIQNPEKLENPPEQVIEDIE
jgi:hypothetical protein